MLARMGKSYTALLRHGLDSDAAHYLDSNGYTVKQLAGMTHESIDALPIGDASKRALRQLDRPPIPGHTLHELLHRAAYTCCTCRRSTPGMIVHHIQEWSSSRNHEIDNLAVLCTACHEKAHLTSGLSHTLSADDIRFSKKEWQRLVELREARAVLAPDPQSLLGSVWDYFNHRRVIDLAHSIGVTVPGLETAFGSPGESERHYRYEGRISRSEQSGYEGLVRRLCEDRGLVVVKPHWTPAELTAVARPNALISLTGYFRFKRVAKPDGIGPGQTRDGYHKAKHFRLLFSFDAWEATSNSSWASSLRRGCRCTAICLLQSIEPTSSGVDLHAKVLAIGTGLGDEKEPTAMAIQYHEHLGEEAAALVAASTRDLSGHPT